MLLELDRVKNDLETVKKQIDTICDLTVSSFRSRPKNGSGGLFW